MTKTGFFISVEGPDGGGKSTQTRLLYDRLIAQGHDVVKTREIGGTPEAETIRDLIVRKSGGDWLPLSMMMMISVARLEHTEKVIKPALAAGKIVLSDRYADSTYVYQVIANENNPDHYRTLYDLTLGHFEPDLTLILDVDPSTSVARMPHGNFAHIKAGEKEDDRFEQQGTALQKMTRDGYLQVARMHPNRCVVVDATADVDKVAEEVWKIVEQRVTARG
jgi:dTMP kinase